MQLRRYADGDDIYDGIVEQGMEVRITTADAKSVRHLVQTIFIDVRNCHHLD